MHLTNSKDPFYSNSALNKNKRATKSSFFEFGIFHAFFVFLILLLLISPRPARASLNSQNMPLLQATAISPFAGQGGPDVQVNNGALLPELSLRGTTADILEIPESGEISVYVVRKGDTASLIAKMFGVSTNTIYWANDLKPGATLQTDQVLIILPISGVRYEVKKGDTLKGIADKFKGDVSDIAAFNGIAVDGPLAIGDVFIIPDGEVPFTESQNRVVVRGKSKERLYGTNAPEYSGYYLRPIAHGRLSQNLHGYNGVDLAAPTGTPIRAAADGEVIFVNSNGYGGGYGKYLIISHPDNGTQTLYAHNSKNLVNRGDKVSQGQSIALVGSTGRSTGPHVHFEVRGAKNPGANGAWAN